MISIPFCSYSDIDFLLKVEPFRAWLNQVHISIMEVVTYMVTPRGSEDRVIERVQNISMHIRRHATKVGVEMAGEIMNATWSDEYFTINIPTGEEGYGVIRFERIPETVYLRVSLGFPEPVNFMSILAFTKMGQKRLIYEGIHMTIKHAAFLIWCEHFKAGLSAPFKDMLQDGEL